MMVRRKLGRKAVAVWALACLAVIAVLTFYIWHLTENIRLGYAIGRCEDTRKNLLEELRTLKAKKAGLLSLERIEMIARRELGLVDARENQIIYEDY
jgi:cell division protein FtsL